MKLRLPPVRGWRTYAACAVLILMGISAGFGIHIPDWIVQVVAGLGGIAGRAAIANNAKKTTEDARALVACIVSPASAASGPDGPKPV